MWINIPGHADDDYIIRLAKLWAPECGGRIGFPPPEKNELVLSIKMGCADTVPFSVKTKHPVLTRPISSPPNPFSTPKFWIVFSQIL